MSEKKTLKISKSARYFVHGADITKAKRVWFVLHGYGQLANYFIRNFEHLDPNENYVIAPEGFHRFYLEGFSGRVGASWMTKEDRLTDIDDYLGYLDDLKSAQNIQKDQEIILFGFSQGVATAMRWLALGKLSSFDKTVFWAGSLPEDLPSSASSKALAETDVHCIYGDSDPFINEENTARLKAHLKNLKADVKWHTYSGDHRIPKEALDHWIESSI